MTLQEIQQGGHNTSSCVIVGPKVFFLPTCGRVEGYTLRLFFIRSVCPNMLLQSVLNIWSEERTTDFIKSICTNRFDEKSEAGGVAPTSGSSQAKQLWKLDLFAEMFSQRKTLVVCINRSPKDVCNLAIMFLYYKIYFHSSKAKLEGRISNLTAYICM